MALARSVTFAEALRRHRLAAEWTQAELAKRAGLSMRAVSDLERGLKRPYKDTVTRLADALALAGAERASFEASARNRTAPLARTASPEDAPATTSHARIESRPPFVGRERELGRITRHLTDDGPRLLVLLGEPGIGKSRLLAESAALAASQGWSVLAGGCMRRRGQEPYAPFVELLARTISQRSPAERRRELAGCSWLVRLLPELAEARAVPAPPWSVPAEQEQRLIFAAVARYLANAAGPSGTLLLLDDLQWAGPDALDLLASLTHTVATVAAAESHASGATPPPPAPPLLIVAACRDTELRPGDPFAVLLADLGREGLAETLSLAPLARSDSGELARLLLADAPAQSSQIVAQSELAAQLAERAGGLPYFLVSCASAVRTASAAVDATDFELPWNVAASIRQRIAALPAPAQEVLGIAAVAGRRVSHATLLDVGAHLGIAEAELLAALDSVDRARLLLESGPDGYQFAHDLVREVLLDELGVARRAVLHRHVAKALVQVYGTQRHPAELAWHLLEAGDAARALPYVMAAGDQAEARQAHVQAERHYRTAVDLAHELGELRREAEALEKLADIGVLIFGRADAVPLYERAADAYKAAGEREGHLRALGQLLRFRGGEGTVAERLLRLRRLLTGLESEGIQPSHGLATIYLGLAMLYGETGLIVEQLRPIRRAEQIARQAGDDTALAGSLRFRALVLCAMERTADALPLFEEARAAAERGGNGHGLRLALTQLAMGYLYRGELQRAQPYAERALEVARQVGADGPAAFQLSVCALLAWYTGEWEQARQHVTEATALADHGDSLEGRLALPRLPLVRGLLGLVSGEAADAATCLDMADALARDTDDRLARAIGAAARAEGEQVAGETAAAFARVSSVLADLRDQPPLPVRAPGPDAAVLLCPRLAWAEAWLDAPVNAASEAASEAVSDVSVATSVAAGTESAHGGHQRSRDLTAASLALARAGSWELVVCDTLRIQALIALRQGQPRDARRAVEESIARCRAIGYRYAEAKALAVYGQLHEAQGEPDQARERYRAALAICDRLGERLYRPQIERALHDTLSA